MEFDKLLTDTPPFDYNRARRILVSAGFIPGVAWNGEQASDNILSIKLPVDGYIEIEFTEQPDHLATIKRISNIERNGRPIPGFTPDFNIARQVIAYAAGWDNEKIAKYCFWPFKGEVTKGDFAFLWQGAVMAANRWIGLASTKFPPADKRIDETKKFFREMINQ